MLKNLFKKKDTNADLVSPLTGKVVPLEEVPDQVFSQKMMGEGIAVDPTSNLVVSPVDGEVVDVFKTKHAISLRADNGAEILVHMGLETVELNGEGFEIKVNNGDKVKKGDNLADFDVESVKAKGYKTITPIILMNGEDYNLTNISFAEEVKAGSEILFHIEAK
ncbi:PTS system IIA component, Glc family [Gracilibacillus ureilyticus]|uniref:PTS system IIA component, Glc family n=1 Tax=Gracilibacillus ureilyticus TaxID=531814 RepID=A0A1H9PKI6_9BACI|nr:PTS glucose transporter subunit IIA [Gracilibacillus ureilyticus]SER48796.1 PTS system IIA component, Glc family [Gracilibacillus ureilyticus]